MQSVRQRGRKTGRQRQQHSREERSKAGTEQKAEREEEYVLTHG
jgi:hypothetical protein